MMSFYFIIYYYYFNILSLLLLLLYILILIIIIPVVLFQIIVLYYVVFLCCFFFFNNKIIKKRRAVERGFSGPTATTAPVRNGGKIGSLAVHTRIFDHYSVMSDEGKQNETRSNYVKLIRYVRSGLSPPPPSQCIF